MHEITDRQLLEFENRFYLHYGAKLAAMREELDLSDVQFFQRLRAIVVDPPADLAVEFGPLLNRLSRKIEIRQRQRLPRSA